MRRAPERPEHLPLYYMEPPDPDILGFDLGASDRLRHNFDRARDLGRVVAGDRNRLVEAPDLGFFVALYHPVYGAGMPTATVEERRAAIRGSAPSSSAEVSGWGTTRRP